ncbi:MAG: tetratricopeptide repeat protein [bacterium]|nr:tetratricopeptide repeat protein [bacterium]
MMKKAVLSLVVVLLFVSGALAKTQALIRRDGRRHVGLITKVKNGYNIKMRIGEIFVPTDEVARIEDAATPLEEFRTSLSKLKPNDLKGRYKLAQWAFKRGLLSEAAELLKSILKTEPDHERAKLLLEQIDAKSVKTEDPAKLRAEYSKRRAAIASGDAKGYLSLGKWAYEKKLLREAKVVLGKALEIDPQLEEAAKLITEIETKNSSDNVGTAGSQDEYLLPVEDVYRIRLEEFNTEKDTVRVKFRNNVLKRFVTAMAGRDDFKEDMRFGRKFMGYSPIKKLRYILDPGRDITPAILATLKKDIIIETDPSAMKVFRVKIWPIVKKNCASTACHGAPAGRGKLKLFNIPARDARSTYTNFIILAGKTAKSGGRVLDRDNPEESLLLEYLLPKTLVKHSHLKMKKPPRVLFRNREQGVYKIMHKWISSLSGPGYPNYGLKYKPPFGMKLDIGGSTGTLVPRERDRKRGPEGFEGAEGRERPRL